VNKQQYKQQPMQPMFLVCAYVYAFFCTTNMLLLNQNTHKNETELRHPAEHVSSVGGGDMFALVIVVLAKGTRIVGSAYGDQRRTCRRPHNHAATIIGATVTAVNQMTTQ
jgi:hypothetical protein